jgi:hypothetical protein
METVMKAAYFVSGIVTLLTFSEAHAGPEGETVSGFQCEGINIPGLHLSQDDLRTGAGFPWMLDAPRDDATGVARVSGIIYIAWPPVVGNGFLKTMSYGGKIGWLEENAVRPLRRSDGTTGGCTLRRRADGWTMFHLEPGLASITEQKPAVPLGGRRALLAGWGVCGHVSDV